MATTGHWAYRTDDQGERRLVKIAERDYRIPLPSHSVRQDTMPPLRHPKTDEIVESRTRWNEINREHKLVEVGNDLQSNRPREHTDKWTDERILDAAAHAEAILNDPARRNSWRNEQIALAERNAGLLSGKKR